MNVNKWIPWNWFKKEEEDAGSAIPVQRSTAIETRHDVGSSLARFHQDIDRLFDQAFGGFGGSPFGFHRPILPHVHDGLIKPTLDLCATEKEYTVSVEVPGVDETDVRVEIADDTLIIRGEKQQETEEKEKNYYRMERSYGSFQRVLSLPDDADQEGVTASFKNGVLKIGLPRVAAPRTNVRRIDVKSA